MKYSIIITAWKEPDTVRENLRAILEPTNLNLLPDSEIILVCPDDETYNSGLEMIQKYNFEDNFVYIKDPQNGKPFALNLAFDKARGEILICMDGDILVGKESLQYLVTQLEENEKIGAVSGRPVSSDKKNTMLGYWGNLLADAAHVKRLHEYSNGKDYFVSGYLFAMRKIDGFKVPEDIMSDDAWISLQLIMMDYKIGYSPNSYVYIKYAKNLKDWFAQKRRSAGGYVQLRKYLNYDMKSILPKRNLVEEAKYFFFPLTYIKSFRQFIYSLLLYPARLLLWILIFYDKIRNQQSGKKIWSRIETTK